MKTPQTILADPLAVARQASAPIGFVGLDIPLEVLTAGGRTACHLPWDRSLPTPRADGWLESGFAPWTRRMLEDWAEGRFDLFEHVVFTRGDDNAQRLYYYICELQRRGQLGGPKPLIFDVAYIDRPSSLARTCTAITTLCRDLGIALGDLDRPAINARRTHMARIQASRSGNGPHHERLARASLFAPIEADAPQTSAARRILLAGTPPPDSRLHEAVERAAASIVAEAHERNLGWMGPLVSENGDPVSAIADALRARQTGARTFGHRGERLMAAARAARADAVLLWLIEEEESEVWHVPAQRRALTEAGMPSLVLTRRPWHDDITAEISAFLTEQVA